MIGFGVGVLLILKSIRDGKFQWHIALPNLIGAIIMGYIAYEIGNSRISEYLNIIWTFFVSINSFLIIDIVSEPELVKKLFARYIGEKYKD